MGDANGDRATRSPVARPAGLLAAALRLALAAAGLAGLPGLLGRLLLRGLLCCLAALLLLLVERDSDPLSFC